MHIGKIEYNFLAKNRATYSFLPIQTRTNLSICRAANIHKRCLLIPVVSSIDLFTTRESSKPVSPRQLEELIGF